MPLESNVIRVDVIVLRENGDGSTSYEQSNRALTPLEVSQSRLGSEGFVAFTASQCAKEAYGKLIRGGR